MSVYADNPVDVQQFILEQGRPLLWRARYTDTPATALGLVPDGATDRHNPVGVARCPVCYNQTLQRPASSVCTTCYGTTYTGGFAATIGLLAVMTTGTYTRYSREVGGLVAFGGTWCLTNPGDAVLLPQDLMLDQATSVRYLVGEEVPYPGILGTPLLRRTQLQALAPDSPWQQVPF